MLALRPVARIDRSVVLAGAREAPALAFDVAKEDELARILHRKRAKQDVVDETEHRGVGADAESKRRHDRGGEAAIVKKLPCRDSKMCPSCRLDGLAGFAVAAVAAGLAEEHVRGDNRLKGAALMSVP